MSSHHSITRRLLLQALFATSAIVHAANATSFAASTSVKSAETLVHEAANGFLAAVRNGSKRQDFARLFDHHVSINAIAMFALGKHRRKLPPKQRTRYISLVNEMLLDAVTRHARYITGNAFVVTGSRGNIVQGYIDHDSGSKTDIGMRMVEGRINDIRVEGIWLTFVLRQEFNRIIDGNGGDIAAIIQHLENGGSL